MWRDSPHALDKCLGALATLVKLDSMRPFDTTCKIT